MESSMPTDEIVFKMPYNGVWCISGIATLSRFKYTRSPNTERDAQFLVELGFLKNIGLKNIHSNETTPGIKHHQPIQARLQNANTISGSTEYRVHTLQGFACFIQFSSSSRNRFAIFLSSVIRGLWEKHCIQNLAVVRVNLKR